MTTPGDDGRIVRLEKIVEAKVSMGVLPRRRSSRAQEPRRAIETAARLEAVSFRRASVEEGERVGDVARSLSLSRRTLLEWERRERTLGLEARARGRPLVRSAVEERNRLLGVLQSRGPGAGVATLRSMFPRMARREIQDILGRYRRLYVREHSLLIHELTWTVPGAVWAADHTDAPASIDDRYPSVLSVRDLASGNQLLWLPVEEKSAVMTAQVLESLFLRHGAPLVLKSDNHGAFRGQETVALLERYGVIALPSPGGMPRYNGSAEAGIGALKCATYYEAARHGRPCEWRLEDMEAARATVNARLVDGRGTFSREDLWRSRRPIDPHQRAAFAASVEEKRLELLRDPQYDAGSSPPDEATTHRTSVRRALVAHGFLRSERRRVPLPFRRVFWAKIM